MNNEVGCENDGKFNGYRWIDPTAKPLSHAVLLDKNGIVAGIQFLMPYSEVNLKAENVYRFYKQPLIQNETIFGVDYFYITAYFIDPTLICSIGRDSNHLAQEGTASQLYIQAGPSPMNVTKLAMNNPPKGVPEGELAQGWNENNCYSSMGWHRFYNQESWSVDNCTTFTPFFIMYDNEGDLNGFGFIVPGKASSPSIEWPSKNLTEWTAGSNNATDSVPQCFTEVLDTLGLSSMHVFLSQHPYQFKCVEENLRLQNGTSSESESIFSTPWKIVLKGINIIINLLHNLEDMIEGSPNVNDKDNDNHIHQTPETETDKLPICVVGGGISGLGVALLLQNVSRNVEVFERSPIVGGKIKTFRQDRIQVDMNAFLVRPENKILINFVNQIGLNLQAFNETDHLGYAIEDMIPKEFRNNTLEDSKTIEHLIEQYIKIRNSSSTQSQLAYGYLNAKSNLLLPMKLWMKKNKLDSKLLQQIFTMLVTNQGYGDLKSIPAIYVLQHLDANRMQSLIKPTQDSLFFVKEGLGKLVEGIAAKLVKKVHLNHNVIRITRDTDFQTIEFDNAPSQKCSKVVLAFPPLLPSVSEIMDLDAEEINVLDQIKIHKYTSAAVSIPTWTHNLYVEAFTPQYPDNPSVRKPNGNGEVTTFLKQSKDQNGDNVYSAYSWIKGDFNTVASKSELDKIGSNLHDSLHLIDELSGKQSKILKMQNPEYFPHVNSKNLKKGFYQKFDKIQGKNGVYYASTLLTVENMEKALEMSEALVKKYLQ